MGFFEATADVIKDAISSPKKALWLSALILVVCIGLGVALLLVMRFLPPRSDIVIPLKSGNQIVLERHPSDYENEYVVVIHPQGWQETGIQVRRGDTIRLAAGGSVEIDLHGLVDSVNRRTNLEAQGRKTSEARRDPGRFLPERRWTSKQVQSIMPVRGWTDPDGYAYSLQDTTFPGRTDNKMMPGAPYGALLMAISPTRQMPTPRQAILVGMGRYDDKRNPCQKDKSGVCRFEAGSDGKVWFIVNDVWDGADSQFPDKFYIDNIGSYYATVSVRAAGHPSP